MSTRTAALTGLLLLASCGGGGTEPVPPTIPLPPNPVGTVTIEACLGLGGVSERCTLVQDASACTGDRCRRLAIVFSGGEQGCATGAGYATVMAGYAARGYAVACVNAFETSAGSGAIPYVDEAARYGLAVKTATTGAWAKAFWSGEHLLLEGISHGASAPVILMARTTLDDQPHWKGSGVTAGCFFDGSYDQAASASLLATGNGGAACTSPVPSGRWLERYCGAGATAATCDLTAVPKALEDTITAAPAANFAVHEFRLFECGSALGACAGDILPAGPIEALCSALDAAPAHRCTFTSLPTDGHLTCYASQYDQCRSWFDGLTP